MSKKNLLLIATGVAITLFTSCKKDSPGQNNNSSYRVKTYTEDITSSTYGNSVTTFNLSYDGDGRLISFISNSTPQFKSLFAYTGSNSFTTDLYTGNTLMIHEDVFLNSSSLIDSTFQYNDTEDSSTEKYIYNTADQLLTIKEYEYSKATGGVLSNIITYTYDANGNIIMTAGTDTNVDTYEYCSDALHVMPDITGLPTVIGSQKHYLVKKHTLTSNGYLVGSADLTYTFDNKDRISTETAVTDDGSIVVKTYTYY